MDVDDNGWRVQDRQGSRCRDSRGHTHTHTQFWFRLEESRSAQQVGQQTQSELSDLHAAEPDG